MVDCFLLLFGDQDFLQSSLEVKVGWLWVGVGIAIENPNNILPICKDQGLIERVRFREKIKKLKSQVIKLEEVSRIALYRKQAHDVGVDLSVPYQGLQHVEVMCFLLFLLLKCTVALKTEH